MEAVTRSGSNGFRGKLLLPLTFRSILRRANGVKSRELRVRKRGGRRLGSLQAHPELPSAPNALLTVSSDERMVWGTLSEPLHHQCLV